MMSPQLTPKLVVGAPDSPGAADRAIDFYRRVLDAELGARHVMGHAVVFASLTLPGGARLEVKDADDVDPGPPEGGGGVVLSLVHDDPDTVLARAVDHGGSVLFEVDDQPYGSRQGRFRDPFGHEWIVGTPLTMTDVDIQAALDAWVERGGPAAE